jgi:glycosyltransferase involved in cell wall biosynthesis
MPLSSTSNTRRSVIVPGNGGDVLLLSMRRLSDLVAYCIPYEFEDLIGEITGADRVEPDNQRSLDTARRAYKLARMATGSTRLARALSPLPSTVHLKRDYELFFPVFNHTHELYTLAAIPNWRQRCRYAACYVSELWLHLLPRYLLEILASFDHIFVGVYNVVDEVAKITGRPCSYLPLASDVLKFSPAPEFPRRMIDVYNIGRRSDVTHRALIELSTRRRLLYSYDTVAASGFDMKQRTFRVQSASEHRLLFSNMLRRSRYYVTNRARINEPEYTGGRDEISARFYEGIAAGAVMIGTPPRVEPFKVEFGWKDALIEVPFDAPDIGEILSELDSDPDRLARIRRDNVRNAALQHDWLHRLKSVYATFGIAPTPAMVAREQRLAELATLPDSVWPAEEPLTRMVPRPALSKLDAAPSIEPLAVASEVAPAAVALASPLISIVIPTHNRAAILQRALDSVVAQTFQDYEVIVVDDASKDNTQAFLRTYESARLRVLRNETNRGVSAARNLGARAARGEFITFLDDDDALRPDALDALNERISNVPGLDFLWGGRLVHEMDAADRPIGTREEDWSQAPATVRGNSFLQYVLTIATSSVFTIRRTAFERTSGFDEKLRVSEDRDLFIALAKGEYLGAPIRRSLIDIYERYSSLSRSTGVRSGADMDLTVISKHRDFLDLPQHREFLDRYLVTVFEGFLLAGKRRSAMRMVRELHSRNALHIGMLRRYVRHAPEFRAIKAMFRYDAIRRFKNRIKQQSGSPENAASE